MLQEWWGAWAHYWHQQDEQEAEAEAELWDRRPAAVGACARAAVAAADAGGGSSCRSGGSSACISDGNARSSSRGAWAPWQEEGLDRLLRAAEEACALMPEVAYV